MFSFSFSRPKGAGAKRSIGRSGFGLGLFACAAVLTAAGCGGGTDYSDPSDSGNPVNPGGTPVVVGTPSRLRVGGTRPLTEVSLVGSPNVTPYGADDFTFLPTGSTEGIALNYPRTYTLIAPQIWADRQFKEWQVNGTVIETDSTLQLSQLPATVNGTLTAVYEPYTPAGDFFPNYAADLDINARFQTLPIKIWIDPQLAPNEGAKQLLRNGIGKWTRASGGVISYVEVENAGQADIRLRSVDNLLNGGAGILGVALSLPDLDTINNSDLDYSTLWLVRAQSNVQNAAERREYESTVAHEMGHALGIQGHSAVETDLMYPFSGPLELTDRDINTVASAYRNYFNGGNTTP